MDLNVLLPNIIAYSETHMFQMACIVLGIVLIIKVTNFLLKTAFSIVVLIIIVKFLMDAGILTMLT